MSVPLCRPFLKRGCRSLSGDRGAHPIRYLQRRYLHDKLPQLVHVASVLGRNSDDPRKAVGMEVPHKRLPHGIIDLIGD